MESANVVYSALGSLCLHQCCLLRGWPLLPTGGESCGSECVTNYKDFIPTLRIRIFRTHILCYLHEGCCRRQLCVLCLCTMQTVLLVRRIQLAFERIALVARLYRPGFGMQTVSCVESNAIIYHTASDSYATPFCNLLPGKRGGALQRGLMLSPASPSDCVLLHVYYIAILQHIITMRIHLQRKNKH